MSQHTRKPSSPRSGHAFTLVELLICIGIICLLIAMIMPSLAKARELAKEATCVKRLHDLSQALVAYSTQYDGFLPPWHTPVLEDKSPEYKDSSWIWTDSLSGFMSNKTPGPKAESTAHIANSAWVCPNAKINPDTNELMDYNARFPKGGVRTSYATTCGGMGNTPQKDTGGNILFSRPSNNAGLVPYANSSALGVDGLTACNRYSRMDGKSVVLFCARYDGGGIPDPFITPDEWHWDATGTRPADKGGPRTIKVGFAHVEHNPALIVSGAVKSYGKGTIMGGDSSTCWVPQN